MRRNRKGKAKISAATISRAPAATANPVVPVIPMIPAMPKEKGKKIIETRAECRYILACCNNFSQVVDGLLTDGNFPNKSVKRKCSYGSGRPRLLARKTHAPFTGSAGTPIPWRVRRQISYLLDEMVLHESTNQIASRDESRVYLVIWASSHPPLDFSWEISPYAIFFYSLFVPS